MVRRTLLLIAALTSFCHADTGFYSTINVTETDGSPACQAGQLKVSTGTLTCSGQTATISTGGGGGGSGGSFINNTSTLQTGATFYVSSGTVASLNVGNIYTSSTVFIGGGATPYAFLSSPNDSAIQIPSAFLGHPAFGVMDEFSDPYFNSPMVLLGSNGLSGCIGLKSGILLDHYGFCAPINQPVDLFWTLPASDAAGFWKSDGSAGLSIASLSASDMSALLASTNVWTGGNTYRSSTTFSGNVGISSGVLLSGAAGSSGQVLTSGGAGAVPTWAAAVGGIVSPGTFTWVNNFGIQASTLTLINSGSANSLTISSVSTGVNLVSVSSSPAIAAGDFLLTVSSVPGTAIFAVQNSGHLISSGTVPTMGACGTSPSVIGTDNAGAITVGSGVVTSCTLNFAAAWGQTPVCVQTNNSTAVTGDISAISTTAVTFSFSATLGGGQIYYLCFGSKG